MRKASAKLGAFSPSHNSTSFRPVTPSTIVGKRRYYSTIFTVVFSPFCKLSCSSARIPFRLTAGARSRNAQARRGRPRALPRTDQHRHLHETQPITEIDLKADDIGSRAMFTPGLCRPVFLQSVSSKRRSPEPTAKPAKPASRPRSDRRGMRIPGLRIRDGNRRSNRRTDARPAQVALEVRCRRRQD